MKNKIIELLSSYMIMVKMGSDGCYEQDQAILEEDFTDLADDLIKKLTTTVDIENVKFIKDIEEAIEDGEDIRYDEGGGHNYFNKTLAIKGVLGVIKRHLV